VQTSCRRASRLSGLVGEDELVELGAWSGLEGRGWLDCGMRGGVVWLSYRVWARGVQLY
jgi:hypothetical protein